MTERSQREKMLAGEKYNILDAELEADRQEAKRLMHLYNTAVSEEERQLLLPQMLGRVGQNALIWPPFYCSYGKHITLGDNVFMNYMCTILDNGGVHIGSHVMLGPMVQIYTAEHPLQAEPRNQGWETARPITIRDDVWIAGGAILLPGGTFGRGAGVGAGAVVTKDVPACTVVAGNPARVIRELDGG